MMETIDTNEPKTSTPGASSFMFHNSPAMQELLLKPISKDNPIVNDVKLRRLYLQASSQQWYAPQKLNFDLPVDSDEQTRQVWARLSEVFYTLEKMGLNVIANMMPKAAGKLKSDEVVNYLAVQCHDEARHVFVIENYLKKLGAPPAYDYKYHILGQAASMGFYRVENWLFSTLFSENFASVFLRRSKAARIDPFGAEMCKYLMIDESRHLHFLHIVLPDVMERLSLLGRTYVKAAQFFIMKFSEVISRTLEADAAYVGINRRDMLEEIFENVEKAYEGFGVTRQFLKFPKITDKGVATGLISYPSVK
jgi:P-aminobenzoate N-oxygenase AurF